MHVANHEGLLLYYERTVLCHYRASPDEYLLHEDDIGGSLRSLLNDADQYSPILRVRFGYRRLQDGRVCVAAFSLDVQKTLPKRDLAIWNAHRIQNPEFIGTDPAFEQWVSRSLEGQWVEPSTKNQLVRVIRFIRALTFETLGKPLWRTEEHHLLNYPVAENTDAYAKAHLELYRLLIDCLDKDCILLLAGRVGVTPSDASKTLNSLKEIIPDDMKAKIHEPLKKCYTERQKNHGIPGVRASRFQAFDAFHADLSGIVESLNVLEEWLENVLGADAKACLQRREAMEGFPKFIGPPRPEFKLSDLKKAEGKTIKSVEFGELPPRPSVPQSEALVLHFTDGSSISVQIGSNALNLAGRPQEFKPEDLETDLMVFWAPSAQREAR